MFKKLLVPVDFSKKSHHGLKVASAIVSKSKGEIDLFHVVQAALMAKLTEHGEYESLGKSGQQMLLDVLATNNGKIEKLASMYRTDSCKINTRLKVHEAPDKIAEHIHQEDYDLLVIGGELNYSLDEMMKVNHSEKIVKIAKKPVLIINQAVNRFDIKKIVVPTNLADDYGQQIDRLKEVQSFFNAKVEFLHINTPGEFLTTYQINKMISSFQDKYGFKDCDFTVISDKSRKKGILKAAKHLNADMIGLLSFQSSSFSKFFRGDITEHLVNNSSLPIMVLNVQR